jgi:DNA-binding transcriptional ArsR family regulator
MKTDPAPACRPETTKPNRESFEIIAQLFKAFSDATRLQLLQALRKETKNVGELVLELGLTRANVSKHLQVLFDAKILHREKRGTASFYTIDDEFIYPLCELICNKVNRDFEGRKPLEFTMSVDDFSI